jgi:hypothetical protein
MARCVDTTPTKAREILNIENGADVTDATNVAAAGATMATQGAPTALTGASTITAAGMVSKIVTLTHTVGSTVALTLDTGAVTDAAVTMAVGDSMDWSLINLSAAAADTGTVTASDGHTIVGNPIVQSEHVSTGGITGSAGMFRTRKTAADTFVTYRVG